MLATLPLPVFLIAASIIGVLLFAGVRRRNTACLVGAGCILALTVGFTVSATLLA